MRNTESASRPRPLPSDMSKVSRMVRRRASALWPSGTRTAVSDDEYSSGWRHHTSSPHARTARRVASAWRSWRRNTFPRPSSRSMSIASERP